MAQDSKIEWCHHTANLWWGCTKVHAGCDHCYAETLSNRWNFQVWGNDNPRREIKSFWKDLKKFQQIAKDKGEIHRVFVGSMMDIFEKPMPLADSNSVDTGQLRDQFFDFIPCYPNLMFLLLTKRPSNINKYIPESWKENPPPNVMFGTSPCNQETADTLIPQLLQVNGKRFLSVEPMLGEVNLNQLWTKGIHWVICGGESGPKKRPMDIGWAGQLRDRCKSASIPFFMKQIDKVQPIPEDILIRQFPVI